MRTPRDSRSSPAIHSELVSVSEEELPETVCAPVMIVTATQGASNPTSDDGEGMSGGGALQINSNSYVQSQVYKFKVGHLAADLGSKKTDQQAGAFCLFAIYIGDKRNRRVSQQDSDQEPD